MKETQNERVLNYIDERGSITTLDAFRDLGITRLAARIHDLRREGIDIDGEMIEEENRFGEKVRFMCYRRAV
jgi:hypothetical protein